MSTDQRPPIADTYAADRSCLSKSRYSTADIATTVATNIYKARGTVLRTYWCEICGGYHLTHQRVIAPLPSWREPKISAREEAEARKRDRSRGRRRGRY